MDFKKSTIQHSEQKYAKMLKGETPPPYDGSVKVGSSDTYSSKRNAYTNRLSRENSEFNSAVRKVNDTKNARLRNENDALEGKAMARYKLFKMLKTVAFLLPIVLAVFTGINIFSNKTLYDQITGVPYIFFWIVFALAMLVGAVMLIRSLNQKEIYHNRNRIDGSVKYSALAILVVVAVLAVAILFVSLTTGLVSQSDDFSFVDNNGQIYLTGYDGNAPVVVLPDNIEGRDYLIAEGAFKNRDDIVSVTIPTSVIMICEDAFDGCNIKSLTILARNTDANVSTSKEDATVIGDLIVLKNAFGEDSNLNIEEINVPAEALGLFKFGTSLKSATVNSGSEVSKNTFFGCSSLKSVVINSGIQEIGYGAFRRCDSLEEITIPFVGKNRNPDQIYHTTFGYIFGDEDDDGYMESVSGNYVTSNTNSEYTCQGGYGFVVPASLKKVIVTDQETVVDKAFINCDLIEEIVYEKTITAIGLNAFENCAKIKAMPDYELSELSKGAFKGCTSLESIKIPSSLTIIGEYTFYGCAGLKSITIPNTVTEIRYGAFGKCDSLEEITVPFIGKNNAPTEARLRVFGYIFGDTSDNNSMSSSSSKYLTSSTDSEYTSQNGYIFLVPQSLKRVTVTDQSTICDYAFVNCDLIERITYEIPATHIGAYAFSDCASLESVPENTVSTISDRAFQNCSSLKTIDLDRVTSIGESAFNGCSAFQSITLNSVIEINKNAFSKCSALESLTLSDALTTIRSYAFSECSALKVVSIPQNVNTIETGAFSNCKGIVEIYFNAKDFADLKSNNLIFSNAGQNESGIKVVIGKDATRLPGYLLFPNANKIAENPNVTSLTFEEGSVCTTIGKYVFYGSTSLKSVELSSGITTIATYAFSSCHALESITIPSSVKLIETKAFYNCTRLSDVVFQSSYGWYRSSYSNPSSGSKTQIDNLSNTSTASSYLKSTYDDYYWHHN